MPEGSERMARRRQAHANDSEANTQPATNGHHTNGHGNGRGGGNGREDELIGVGVLRNGHGDGLVPLDGR
jgi:hypothetical protein